MSFPMRHGSIDHSVSASGASSKGTILLTDFSAGNFPEHSDHFVEVSAGKAFREPRISNSFWTKSRLSSVSLILSGLRNQDGMIVALSSLFSGSYLSFLATLSLVLLPIIAQWVDCCNILNRQFKKLNEVFKCFSAEYLFL